MVPPAAATGEKAMSPAPGQVLRSVLQQYEREILGEWIQNQLAATTVRGELMREGELREQCREFLALLNAAVQAGSIERHDSAEWNSVREFLGTVSRSRAKQGFTPTETALFVFSLKQPLFTPVAHQPRQRRRLCWPTRCGPRPR